MTTTKETKHQAVGEGRWRSTETKQ